MTYYSAQGYRGLQVQGDSIPKRNSRVHQMRQCGKLRAPILEASILYAPLSGAVGQVNEKAKSVVSADIYEDPYEEGWLFTIVPDYRTERGRALLKKEYGNLLDATAYRNLIAQSQEYKWVYVDSITYTVQGGKYSDRDLLVTITLVDQLGEPVPGMRVEALLKSNEYQWKLKQTTDNDGSVSFLVEKAPPGVYATDITDIESKDEPDPETREDAEGNTVWVITARERGPHDYLWGMGCPKNQYHK